MYINGYLIEKHYDRESWDSLDYISARKDFADDSFDYFSFEKVPDNYKDIDEYIKSRTDDDILESHFNVIINGDNWDAEDFEKLNHAYEAFSTGNMKEALSVLETMKPSKRKGLKPWKESMEKHLRRIIAQQED